MVVAFILVGTGVGMVNSTSAPAAQKGDATASRGLGLALVKTLSGSGSRVVAVSLPKGPLVVRAMNGGSSNFVLYLRAGGSKDLLINEIGPWRGDVVAENGAGPVRLQVEAEGVWTLKIYRPTTAGLRPITGTFRGSGSTVIPVNAGAGEYVVTSQNAGDSNFVIYYVGFGRLSGKELVVNEIGPYRGQTVFDAVSGSVLLWITAKDSWTVRVTR